jgi:hypothetical protein
LAFYFAIMAVCYLKLLFDRMRHQVAAAVFRLAPYARRGTANQIKGCNYPEEM